MTKIQSIDDIESIYLHWSESNHINLRFDCDRNGDINKPVNTRRLDHAVTIAGQEVGAGFDKTVLTIRLKNGVIWCSECKFRIKQGQKDLLSLLNTGE